MKKIVTALVLFAGVSAQAATCIPVFSQAISPIEKMEFLPQDLKLHYKPAAFSSNFEIGILFQNKMLLSFSTKMNSVTSIATDYVRGEHSSTRQAFDKAYQRLSYKLWLLGKSQLPIKLDVTKLSSIGNFGGRCLVDVSTLDALFVEKPNEPKKAVEIEKEPVKNDEPPVPAKPVFITPPDRSSLVESSPTWNDFVDKDPVR